MKQAQNNIVQLSSKAVLISILAVIIGKSLPCDAADLQMEGFQFVKAKNYAKALACFETALKEHPNSWQMLQTIGNCHMELGQYDKAIAYFQKSIEAGGLHATQCINVAAVYQRLGDTKKALSWLKLACSVDPAQAADPTVQASLLKLQDPQNNPTGSLTAADYMVSSFKGWPKEAMPIKIYARKNFQIPGFHAPFVETLRDCLDQWCKATGNAISYKFVDTAESANVVFDYTDQKELVSSRHELGIDGIAEGLVKQDGTPGPTNVVVLVKDGPNAPQFRNRALVTLCCLHEVGHALGMHGHSPNNQDVMFPSVTMIGRTCLTERDKNTIKLMYTGSAAGQHNAR